MKNLSVFLSLIFISCIGLSQNIKNISNHNWHVWLDKNAPWQDDSLYLPPADLSSIPENPPTIGWDSLFSGKGKKITLPATVEEHFWTRNGNTIGVAGDYTGVSWFYTTIEIPGEYRGKRVVLHFESVRFRAEVYVNSTLTGYDIIAGTPFEVDISDNIRYGEKNRLAVRITDPPGNFTWRDYAPHHWGNITIPPGHGFGGITGPVRLVVTDKIFIDNVFIKNKPALDEADLEISMQNRTKNRVSGSLEILVYKKGAEHQADYRETINKLIERGSEMAYHTIRLKNAEPWTPENPQLYTLKINWKGKDDSNHEMTEQFGFRWFDILDVNGDRQLFLNEKRIVLRTAISWGFWPSNGIYPTPDLARKQIQTAKQYGLNMLNFHRAIGQPKILGLADETGLLYYEEPGGYGHYGDTEFTRQFNREKLMRMIKRDRNHPSLIIYNMINEAGRDPKPHEKEDMRSAHKLDETRIITFSSQYYPKHYHDGRAPKTPAEGKLFMEPYDHEPKIFGWWDEHHAGGPGAYKDDLYKSPGDYYRYTDHKREIIFWGEDGAIGTPPRLQLIHDEIKTSGKKGWDGHDFEAQYQAYNNFLSSKNFKEAFPDVDALTTSLGNVAIYYQGRTIENIRINNIADGYAVNGWESMKIENHSGIMDVYRNPKGDPDIMARYNQPLFVAVKARNKVIPAGEETLVDFFIVNEKDVSGRYRLKIVVSNESGQILNQSEKVFVKGNNTYGQLLHQGFGFVPEEHGYYIVEAFLQRGKKIIATGKEKILSINIDTTRMPAEIAVIDTAGRIQKMLDSFADVNVSGFTHDSLPKSGLLIANDLPANYTNHMDDLKKPLIDWITNGNTFLAVTNTSDWAEYFDRKEVVEYHGREDAWILWYGGNFFVREHPLFKDLPVNTAFNWEYQSLAVYDRERYGLRLKGEECVTGLQVDHKKELFTSVCVISCGEGHIILSTLDLEGAIVKGDKASIVAKKILANYIDYGLSVVKGRRGEGEMERK